MSDLRKIVDEASTGPWRADSNDSVYADHHQPCWVVCDVLDGDEADARFIATFDPVLVSALLGVVGAARHVDHFTRRHPNDLPPLRAITDLSAALDRLEEVRRD